MKQLRSILVTTVLSIATPSVLRAQAVIPKSWDEAALAGWHVPLATPGNEPVPLSSTAFYKLPELKIYKNYAVYAPGRTPAGYLEKLRQAEPELIFEPSRYKSEKDWIQAGEIVFDAPVSTSSLESEAYVDDAAWFREHNVPVANDGTVPFYRYVVREKGKIEIGTLSCGNCHTRVLPDGSVIKGAQGNFPRSQTRSYVMTVSRPAYGDAALLAGLRLILTHDYDTPWLKDNLNNRMNQMTLNEIIAAFEAAPAGVTPCHNSSLLSPVQVPDLIGIRDRKYFDHTGHARHRDIGDMMRFSAFIQGNTLAGFGAYQLPASVPGFVLEERMSDAQLYALANYLYALQPPPNPNRPSKLSARGALVFRNEGCGRCHTAPLYTNNSLTLAKGFDPTPEQASILAVTRFSVGTDPTLALRTRKGTGYYKIPSLKGVWYRGPFEHNGSVATLEDWFDPARLREDYVPTGFKGSDLNTRAVKGHEFGLRISPADKAALIAFLRTL
jgi:hypothetical protein